MEKYCCVIQRHGNTEQHWVQVTLARMFTDLQITRLNFSSQLSEYVGGQATLDKKNRERQTTTAGGGWCQWQNPLPWVQPTFPKFCWHTAVCSLPVWVSSALCCGTDLWHQRPHQSLLAWTLVHLLQPVSLQVHFQNILSHSFSLQSVTLCLLSELGFDSLLNKSPKGLSCNLILRAPSNRKWTKWGPHYEGHKCAKCREGSLLILT